MKKFITNKAKSVFNFMVVFIRDYPMSALIVTAVISPLFVSEPGFVLGKVSSVLARFVDTTWMTLAYWATIVSLIAYVTVAFIGPKGFCHQWVCKHAHALIRVTGLAIGLSALGFAYAFAFPLITANRTVLAGFLTANGFGGSLALPLAFIQFMLVTYIARRAITHPERVVGPQREHNVVGIDDTREFAETPEVPTEAPIAQEGK